MAERITDRSGRTLARVETHGDRKIVKDRAGRILGHTRPGGTYDRLGRKVSGSEEPGLLVQGDHDGKDRN